MNWKHYILVLACLAWMPSGWLGAEAPLTAPELQAETEVGEYGSYSGGIADWIEDSPFSVRGPRTPRSEAVARFGWWGVSTDGNLLKVGEYQGLDDNSAFWDLDRLFSDGSKTIDFSLTGTENESTDASFYFFRPGVSAEVDYGRFLHRLDHDPHPNFPYPFHTDPLPSGTPYVGQLTDDFAGEDYAIRVQELDARFKGRLTENIRWRLNVWGMRKHGERQADALLHYCDARQCHLMSQRQRIDWLTMEIEPVIEGNFGPVTVEYSRTMRSFNQNDQLVSRFYAGHPDEFSDPTAQHIYGVVPENFTQVDRLKFGVDVTENTRLYAVLFNGDTKNRHRDIHRKFDGYDIRVTNQSIDGLKLTGYVKEYWERNQAPKTFPENDDFNPGHQPQELFETGVLHAPIDRDTTKAGLKARWRPFTTSRLALTGGYEYRSIERNPVTYTIAGPSRELDDPGIDVPPDFPGYPQGLGPFTFVQPTTKMNVFRVGTEMRMSRHFDSFLRYEMRQIEDPLFGVRPEDQWSVPTAVNTNQPEHEDLVEFGGTWMPAYNVLFSATFGLLNRHHCSPYANFDEDNYPIVLTAWWAPTPRWSISGGLAFMSNWIDQDITIGTGAWQFNLPLRTWEGIDDVPFSYGSRADVISLGTTYAATDRMTLSGGLEFARSSAIFDDPSIPNLDLTYLPGASDVLTETTRFNAGMNYRLSHGMDCYLHYNFYDWNDKAGNGESGTAHMFLGGLAAAY